MKRRTHGLVHLSIIIRMMLVAFVLGSMVLAVGCGSDSHHTSSAEKYPAGISEDVEQQLKYDARVESFTPEGDDLIVNVNDAWMHSPPGIRERALGHWFSLWKPSQNTASKIVVKFDGNEVERWTAEKGYEPASKEEKTAAEG
jgi:hypothetical protein